MGPCHGQHAGEKEEVDVSPLAQREGSGSLSVLAWIWGGGKCSVET